MLSSSIDYESIAALTILTGPADTAARITTDRLEVLLPLPAVSVCGYSLTKVLARQLSVKCVCARVMPSLTFH